MFDKLRASKLRFVLGPFCFGILCGTALVLLLLLIAASVFSFVDIPQEALPVIGTLILAAGGFLAAFVTALIARRQGLLIGGVCGVVFAALALLAGRIVSGSGGSPFWSRLIILLIAALIGGIAGVNKKRRKR